MGMGRWRGDMGDKGVRYKGVRYKGIREIRDRVGRQVKNAG